MKIAIIKKEKRRKNEGQTKNVYGFRLLVRLVLRMIAII